MTAASPSLRSGRTLLLALALVLGVAWVYAPVRAYDWVRYDDEVYVFENPHVARGLDFEALRWAWTSGYAANYHPLTWLSHQLDVELFGLAPGPHHLVNVALHAASALLAFALFAEILASVSAAGVAAALFAWHPLRVESVAWIAERKDVLCLLFTLAALLLYLAYGRAPSPPRYLASLAALALALLAKPTAVTFPLLALVLDHVPLARIGRVPWRRLLLEKLPFALLALGSALATLAVQSSGGATSTLANLGPLVRLLNALRTLWVYVFQSFWPRELAVFYPHASALESEPVRALLPGALAGALLLAGGLAAARVLRRRQPAFGAGLIFFVLALLPVIGLVQVGTQAHADRYTYLPSLGLTAATVAALSLRISPRTVLALGTCAAVALAVCARAEVAHWRDTRALFEHALAVDERNSLAHLKLGELDFAGDDLAGARARFERALALQPGFALALGKLALVERAEGALERAREHLLQALRLEPSDLDLSLNLGVVELERGATAEARAHFEACLAVDPALADAHFNLGLLAQLEGQSDAAERHYRAALALDPAHVEAWSNLGQMALAAGRLEEAALALERASRLAPEDAQGHFNLAILRERRGDARGAEEAFARAFELDPALAPLRPPRPQGGK
jgi:tetratricopeptide (TPR) repeat protein